MQLLRAFCIFECLQTCLLTSAVGLNAVPFLAVCCVSSSALQQAFTSGLPHHESTLPLQVTESPGKSTLEHCAKFTLVFQFNYHMVKETVARVH